MTDYLVAPGFDVALVSLNVITPQPQGDPVAPVERGYGASGYIHDQGSFVKLHWDFIESETEYLTLLTQFGLEAADNAEVTVYVRNSRFVWTRYNGIAQLPEPMQDMKWAYFVRDVDIYITGLEESA